MPATRTRGSCRVVAGHEALSVSLPLLFPSSQSIFVADNSRLSLLSVITRGLGRKEGGGGRGGKEGEGERGEGESVRARLASFHIFTTRIKYQATSLCFHEKKDRGERRDRVVMREIRASKFHRTGGDNARISSLTDSMGEDIETISFPRV